MQKYIVLREDDDCQTICYIGNKPFIGSLEAAIDLADFLKSINKECEYTVSKVVDTIKKGTVKDKYAHTESNSDGTTKKPSRVIKNANTKQQRL